LNLWKQKRFTLSDTDIGLEEFNENAYYSEYHIDFFISPILTIAVNNESKIRKGKKITPEELTTSSEA
jgi:hypothetical protein